MNIEELRTKFKTKKEIPPPHWLARFPTGIAARVPSTSISTTSGSKAISSPPRVLTNTVSRNAFYIVARYGTAVLTAWGKIGTKGQEKVIECGSVEEAREVKNKTIADKFRSGYTETKYI